MAWKKQKPNINFLNISGFLQPLYNSLSSKRAYDLNRLLLNPDGGSNVILTPFYNTDIGNEFVGILVNHNL